MVFLLVFAVLYPTSLLPPSYTLIDLLFAMQARQANWQTSCRNLANKMSQSLNLSSPRFLQGGRGEGVRQWRETRDSREWLR